jgi:hypothetical protein
MTFPEYLRALKVLTALVLFIAVHGLSPAATTSEIMVSQYLKYQFCLEKAYGQGFAKPLGLELVLNRWGVSEPTLSSLSKTSESVQKTEAMCRSVNEIALEPRPR